MTLHENTQNYNNKTKQNNSNDTTTTKRVFRLTKGSDVLFANFNDKHIAVHESTMGITICHSFKQRPI